MFSYGQLIAAPYIVIEQQQQRRSQGGVTARTEARLRGIFDGGNNVECCRHQLSTFSREAHKYRPAVAVVERSLEITKLFELHHLADRLLRQQRAARDFRYGAAAQLQICKHRGMRDASVGEAARKAATMRSFTTLVERVSSWRRLRLGRLSSSVSV